MQLVCPNCGTTVGERIGGKLALGVLAALCGSRVDPVAAVLFGLIGMALGHRYIDGYIDSATRVCPQCQTVLRIADEFLY